MNKLVRSSSILNCVVNLLHLCTAMNYQQTVDYLFHKLPLFSRLGAAAYKKDLHNTIALCDALGNPQQKFKSIHIAGTNGKGSTSHMLAAILQNAGYKTGLYTSPHLHDFRERIKVNGQMCSEEFVIEFTKKIQPQIEKLEPSFFEITVAMAFEYFAQQEVDIAVIEVGLGGRLDSTNIINPELSIITNIGWDHMNLLGNTLEAIAGEKAGIIKPNIPVVIGEVIDVTKPVFEAAAAKSPISYAQEKRYISDWLFEGNQLQVTVVVKDKNQYESYTLDLPGYYQTKNLLTVLEACSTLNTLGWNLSNANIHTALQQVKKLTGLHGRWELVHKTPRLILDVGHNVDGIKEIKEQLELSNYKHLHIVIGMVKDKDIQAVLELLPNYASYYFTKAAIPRALDEITLMESAKSFGLKGNSYAEVNEAIKDAMNHAEIDDLILVCGSVFLIAEVNTGLLGH
ncbi:MAG: dihydrofolate synthase / folylpolyglutamate synthase [Chitinophagaceae bacterium]|nr:MAG: dihydrofolate synthase / folylpolyglutamate synthase [Chitinophagaceae bacterium]